MMGTLATVLAGRKIPTFSDRYRADVEGDIEDVDGVLRITRIRVAYTLSVPPGKADDAREALKTYITRCPARHEREGVHRDHRFGGDQRASGLKPASGRGNLIACPARQRGAATRARRP